MTPARLVLRSLFHHWRSHAGVFLGAVVGTAVLSGALFVGDSIRHTLRSHALARIGKIEYALSTSSRFFREGWADDLTDELGAEVIPGIRLDGSASNADGSSRVNRVQVIGVDDRFWALAEETPSEYERVEDGVFLSRRMADQLNAGPGEEIILRIENPGLIQRDAPLSNAEDSSFAARMRVRQVVEKENLGRFDLDADPLPPFNAFVPLSWLQERIDRRDQANLLLVKSSDSPASASEVAAAVQKTWNLSDAELEVESFPETGAIELSTTRVFLSPSIVKSAMVSGTNPVGVLTYFINQFEVDDRACPYSMVAAIGPLFSTTDPASLDFELAKVIPPGMEDDEIIINEWLAEDLQAREGDVMTMKYFVIGPMRRVEEREKEFRIREIVPIQGVYADPDLMPGFPGLAEAEDCRNWEPGVPIDLDRIRDKDEEYWDEYRGAPKAFVTLSAGKGMWRNRFGDLTAVRYPLANVQSDLLSESIRQHIDPASLGFVFQPIRTRALAASSEARDFSLLFLGFSFFLIVAALLLMGLLNVFGMEQRSEEVGTLLAIGFLPKQIRALYWSEGAILSLLGGACGTLAGVFYGRSVLWGLSTFWSGAIGGMEVLFEADPRSLVIGFFAGSVVGSLTIWLTLRRQASLPARILLSSDFETSDETSHPRSRGFPHGFSVMILAIAAAAALLVSGGEEARAQAGIFFGAGTLLLIGGLGFSHGLIKLLEMMTRRSAPWMSMIGMRNACRRRGRSLAIVALMACGSFLVIAVGANRRAPLENAADRSSGTGGFEFFAETSLPVLHDLNTQAGSLEYGLSQEELYGSKALPLRLLEGDDASCLNLNRPQMPRLLGVEPKDLQDRNAFTFVQLLDSDYAAEPWMILEKDAESGLIPAVVDQNTLHWGLGKSLGHTLTYIDGKGERMVVQLAGAIENSILQGSLIISEKNFISHYPSESGYHVLLIDSPEKNSSEVAETLSFALQDLGIILTPSRERLAAFNGVENAYLSIFQSLGGLGLILGSLGLGVVVLRNVLERRGELALLRAVGFENRDIKWILLSEHWWLALLGIGCGTASGLAAVWPAILSGGGHFPLKSLTITLLAIFGSVLAWTWLATVFSLRGPLLAALRNE